MSLILSIYKNYIKVLFSPHTAKMWGMCSNNDQVMQENHRIDWESAMIIQKERDDKARGI